MQPDDTVLKNASYYFGVLMADFVKEHQPLEAPQLVAIMQNHIAAMAIALEFPDSLVLDEYVEQAIKGYSVTLLATIVQTGEQNEPETTESDS